MDHDYDGFGWYEILTNQGILWRSTSPASGTVELPLPPGATEILFKVGQTEGPSRRVVVNDLRIR